MRLSTGWVLAPVVFGIGLVGDWASAEPTVTIETEYLMTLEACLMALLASTFERRSRRTMES
jgi:hypothetical protein